MQQYTVGSVCSGIEGASVALSNLGFDFQWFSEINSEPSKILSKHYPNIANLGDMNTIAERILTKSVNAPQMICGGTPCQAFSYAGLQRGLEDERGQLTLNFVKIIDANDSIRKGYGLSSTIVLWENVIGVLKDKTNAFGCFVSALAGLPNIEEKKIWPNFGVVHGLKRNVAWRVLDAKYFGVPQQRRRVYVLAGPTNFYPEQVLFEKTPHRDVEYPKNPLVFNKEKHTFEVFREYTDCLLACYGTKWNGNANALNGSLYVMQDNKLRRMTPLECERLMGFPDDYTLVDDISVTSRYKMLGNSWAVPVITWIGKRLVNVDSSKPMSQYLKINTSESQSTPNFGNLYNIVEISDDPRFFISKKGQQGILRRDVKGKMNPRLREVMENQ